MTPYSENRQEPVSRPEQARDDNPSSRCSDSILIAEFEYIAQTAFQAHEDRARVTTFYIVTVGSLIGAMLTSQTQGNRGSLQLGFSVLFFILVIESFITLLQLVRLRQAWFDSAKAMNQIKAFYLTRSDETQMANAFRWTTATLPKKEKAWSISFLLAVQVALLGAILSAAAVIFFGLTLNYSLWGVAALTAIGVFLAHIWLFRRLLR